jgi:phosphoribosylformylglycinamidine cyclo-ligase
MPAILPDTVAASFQPGSWLVPPIFSIIQREGEISDAEMRQVFNMGLGMVAVCEAEAVATLLDAVPEAQVVGRVVERQGSEQVCFKG